MKNKLPLVSIVITAYRVEYYLPELIENFSKINYPNHEIIMVLDPSPDKSFETATKLTKNKKNWRIVANKERIGICESLNIGIKKSRGEYVGFFMTDMVVEPSCISELVKYFREHDDGSIAVVVAKTYDFHKRDRIQAYRMYVMPQTGYYYIPEYGLKDKKEFNKPFEGFSGIDGTLFKKKIFKVIGMYDDDIDLSVTDLDMMWKIWLAGFRVVKVPSAKVYHWSLKLGRQNLRWEFTYAKVIALFLQNYSLRNLLIYLPQLLMVYTVRAVLTLLMGNPTPIQGWLKSLFWTVRYLPKALKKRYFIQHKLRKVSDDYILEKLFSKLSLWDFYKHFRSVQENITPIMLTEEAKNERILTYTK